MVFLLITEAAPMVIDCTGGRGEVCDCSNKSSFFGFLFGISVLWSLWSSCRDIVNFLWCYDLGALDGRFFLVAWCWGLGWDWHQKINDFIGFKRVRVLHLRIRAHAHTRTPCLWQEQTACQTPSLLFVLSQTSPSRPERYPLGNGMHTWILQSRFLS